MKILAPELHQADTAARAEDVVHVASTVSITLRASRMEFGEPVEAGYLMMEILGDELWDDVSNLSLRQLRELCNQVYRSLDSDHPPVGAAARYEALVEEIETRATAVRNAVPTERTRSAFRDNTVYSRFEFIHEGELAGYVRYELRGGQVMLLETVVPPQFRETDLEVEPVLIRRVMLEAHRRRLAVVPLCRVVAGFLVEYPQYLTLIPTSQRPSTASAVIRAALEATAGA